MRTERGAGCAHLSENYVIEGSSGVPILASLELQQCLLCLGPRRHEEGDLVSILNELIAVQQLRDVTGASIGLQTVSRDTALSSWLSLTSDALLHVAAWHKGIDNDMCCAYVAACDVMTLTGLQQWNADAAQGQHI